MTRTPGRIALAIIAATTMTMGTAVGSASAADVGPPIIEGLAGPLGLAVGSDGTVYVTEAFAGRLTAIDTHGTASVLVDVPGQEIAGVDAKGRGHVVYTQTLFDGEAGEEAPPLDAFLARVRPNGKTRQIASTQDYEISHNPDAGNEYGLVGASPECLAEVAVAFPPTNFGIIESHPYAVAIVPGGYVVADAAANAILRVHRNGHISTVAVLPPVVQTLDEGAIAQLAEFGAEAPSCLGESFHGDPVPTDIEVGPDGMYYVSTLPGFPENFGAGQIWKINPSTGGISQVVGGLAGPVDIAVASDGTIWVAELFGGQISEVVGGAVVDTVEADSPGAIEIGRDGTIYATIGVFGPNGKVVTITP